MASKSKKRRRVLGASCILAALIIAGSSFAWFTSRDEVTNRLQASSDYGVSIVESFTPPKNMLPGQEVNKDVYAVNTGNIAAFVKEDVSGKLNYTYESKVASWDKDCVELTLEQVKAIQGGEDGYKTIEAGGFLAWTDAQSTTATTTYFVSGEEAIVDSSITALADVVDSTDPSNDSKKKTFNAKVTVGGTDYYVESVTPGAQLYTVDESKDPDEYTTATGKTLSITDNAAVAAATPGSVYSGRTGDITNPWTPPTDGTYIFRRSIGGTPDNPTFQYSGYCYKDGKYYKIILGDDDYRAASENHTTTPVGYNFDVSADQTDLGNITIAKDGSFTGTPKIWYAKDTKVTDQDATFKLDDTHKRLVVEYANTAATDVTDGSGNTYDATADAARKEVEYKNALGAYNTALIDYNQKTADYNYEKALNDATDTLIDAAVARKNAADTTSGTAATLNNAWNNLKTGVETSAGTYDGFRTTFDTSCKVDTLVPTDVQNTINNDPDLAQCKVNLQKMKDLETEILALDTEIGTTYDQLRHATGKLSADEVESIVNAVKTKLTTLKTKLTAYSNAYAALAENANVASLLDTNGVTTAKATLNGAVNAVDGLKASLDSQVEAYRTAWDENEAQKTADATAEQTWKNAVAAYNKAVTDAKTAYGKAIAETVPTPQTPPAVAIYTNNGDTIVDAHAAVLHGVTGAPAIAANASYADFAGKTKPTDPTNAANASTLSGAKNTADNAKTAYEDAVAKLDASSKITIYVNLDNNYANNWQMDQSTDGTNDVVFYLKSILEAGETSGKLIDSVVLADTVTAKDYKDLTFDLNVGLDSAQINYANDQRTITTEATTGWAMTPTLAAPTDINTAVDWAPGSTATAKKKYTVTTATLTSGGTSTTLTNVNIDEVSAITVGSTSYKYKITNNGKDYYGSTLTNGSEFIEVTKTAGAYNAGTDKIKLGADATVVSTP